MSLHRHPLRLPHPAVSRPSSPSWRSHQFKGHFRIFCPSVPPPRFSSDAAVLVSPPVLLFLLLFLGGIPFVPCRLLFFLWPYLFLYSSTFFLCALNCVDFSVRYLARSSFLAIINASLTSSPLLDSVFCLLSRTFVWRICLCRGFSVANRVNVAFVVFLSVYAYHEDLHLRQIRSKQIRSVFCSFILRVTIAAGKFVHCLICTVCSPSSPKVT